MKNKGLIYIYQCTIYTHKIQHQSINVVINDLPKNPKNFTKIHTTSISNETFLSGFLLNSSEFNRSIDVIELIIELPQLLLTEISSLWLNYERRR